MRTFCNFLCCKGKGEVFFHLNANLSFLYQFLRWSNATLFLNNIVLFHNQNIHFIQYPYRQSYKRQRKDIRSRGNERRHDKNDHNGMFPVVARETVRKESQFGKEPRKHRDFKNEPHCKAHHHQR